MKLEFTDINPETENQIDTRDVKQMLIDLFAESEIIHGQFFDDNRRWCGTCNAPVTTTLHSESNPWNSKICTACSSVWPEFIQEFINSINEDDESLAEFVISQTLN